MNSITRQSTKYGYYLAGFLAGTVLPLTTYAQTGPATQSVRLNNPLRVTSITGLLEALLSIVIVLATPVIVFFIIYSGFLYVTAQGNPEQIKQASRSLTYAIIGGVIIIGAMAIATIVKNLVAAF